MIRPKSPIKVKTKDPGDVGNGWDVGVGNKPHVPTSAEIRAGNHLHDHTGELTIYNKSYHTPSPKRPHKDKSNNSKENIESPNIPLQDLSISSLNFSKIEDSRDNNSSSGRASPFSESSLAIA
jgi:hypothetical protein